MLLWYEQNLCAPVFNDFRGHRVQFRPESFAHLIKLFQKGATIEITKPQKHIERIRNGQSTNAGFGGYEAYRFQRFRSLPLIIARPNVVLELIAQPVVGKRRTGDTLYIKEFLNVPASCKFEILVCRRVAQARLEVVTCHPQNHGNYSRSQYRQIYP